MRKDNEIVPVRGASWQASLQEALSKYDADAPPWRRQPNETSKAYSRFCIYRDLGPRRTVGEARDSDTGSSFTGPGKAAFLAWDAMSRRYNWKERAMAWDEFIAITDELEFLEERKRWRQKRREFLEEAASALPEVIELIKEKINERQDDVSFVQLIRFLRAILQEARAEYGDIDVSSHQTHVNIDQRRQTVEVRTIEVVRDHGALEG